MSEKGVRRFSVSVSPKLLEDFDKNNQKNGLRTVKGHPTCHAKLLNRVWVTSEEERVGVGALVMIYDHETRA